jgi:G2/mitotic-specific cyclin 3/4
MLATGGLKAAAKRTAFGDVSNTAKALNATHDDSAIAGKPIHHELLKPVATQDKSAALLRPAQRPLNINGSKQALHPTEQAPAAPIPKPAQAVQNKRTLTKKAPAIYKDAAADAIQPSSSKPSTSTASTTQTHVPRQAKSQPEIKSEKPVLRSTENKQVNKDEESHAGAKLNTVDNTVSHDASQLALPLTELVNEAHARGIAEEEEAKQAFAKQQKAQQLLPAQSAEPEEYWEEDSAEVYDEQGYTTAHSYRSRGENTTGGATTVILPKVTNKIKKEIDEAKILVESSRTPEDIEDEMWDTSMVAEYGDEIFSYMRELEVSDFVFTLLLTRRVSTAHVVGHPGDLLFTSHPCFVYHLQPLLTNEPILQNKLLPDPHYMDTQAEIQWSMRSVLMDWLIQVHHRFSLLPETLFLCVNYIDRFLSKKVVSLGKLQLVGATAIFVAAKYEEINCPSIGEIVYMVDGGYTADEILKAERFMLSMLQFELGWPGPMSFLRRISKADDYDLETRTLAKYFLEVTIMDERFVGSPPSFIAAAAHAFARLMLNKGDWVCSLVFVVWNEY